MLRASLSITICLLLLAGCAPPGDTGPPWVEIGFRVVAPEGSEAVSLVLLDEISGLAVRQREVPMTLGEGQTWKASTQFPVGSVNYYRYRLQSGPSLEESSQGFSYRLALADGPYEKRDVIASWSTQGSPTGSGVVSGRILNSKSGAAVWEALVAMAGQVAFTDREGRFRISGVVPGEHTLTVIAHDGSFTGTHQGVVVAAGAETSVELQVQPRQPIQVTFEAQAPETTFPGVPVRIAASLSQFGHLFGALEDGSLSQASLMREMVPGEESQYQLKLDLYAGSTFRYRYTLGDGLWNTERDQESGLVTRVMTLPQKDVVIRDQIASWEAGSGGATFLLTVPPDTPQDERVHLQFKSFLWHNPLPMWRLANDSWFYLLYGPLDVSSYRYCRQRQCGYVQLEDERPFPASGVVREISDQVLSWPLAAAAEPAPIIAPEVEGRGFEVGAEIAPQIGSRAWSSVESSLEELARAGSNAITLTPVWQVDYTGELPSVRFQPVQTPFAERWGATIELAHSLGLQVNIRPTLSQSAAGDAIIWPEGPYSQAWWDLWFDQYRSFVMHYASIAGIDKLILEVAQLEPAMPSDSPSAPVNAEFRWRELLTELRSSFPGTLAIELEMGAELGSIPPLLDAFDQVHIYWHAPLAESPDLEASLMQLNAGRLMDEVLFAEPVLLERPLIVSVEYLSFDGAATACAAKPDQGCYPPSAFDGGAQVGPQFRADLNEQSAAINAMLLEVYARPQVTGFYIRRFNPALRLLDLSASVNSKPAFEVLKYWYPRLAGNPG